MDLSEKPWWEPELTIFEACRTKERAACSQLSTDFEDYCMRDGFFQAADNLICDLADQETLLRDERERDFSGLFYPILYCYRHYLEVSIKWLIAIHDEAGPSSVWKEQGHNLNLLWTKAQTMLNNSHGSHLDPDEFRAVGNLIQQFASIDPSGALLRYTHDIKGNRTLETIPRADLLNLRRQMRHVREWFAAVEDLQRHGTLDEFLAKYRAGKLQMGEGTQVA